MSLQTLTKSIRDKNGNRVEQIELAHELCHDNIPTYFPNKEEFVITFLLDRLKEDTKIGQYETCLNINYWDLLLFAWNSEKVSTNFKVNSIRRQPILPIIIDVLDVLTTRFDKSIFLSVCENFITIYSSSVILFSSRSFPDQVSDLLSRFCYIFAQHRSNLEDTFPDNLILEVFCKLVSSSLRTTSNTLKASVYFLSRSLKGILQLLSNVDAENKNYGFIESILTTCVLSPSTLEALVSKKESNEDLFSLFHNITGDQVDLRSIPRLFNIFLGSISSFLSDSGKHISQQKASDLIYKLYVEHMNFLLANLSVSKVTVFEAFHMLCELLEFDKIHRGNPDKPTFDALVTVAKLCMDNLQTDEIRPTIWNIFASLLNIDFDSVLPLSYELWKFIDTSKQEENQGILLYLERLVNAHVRARSFPDFCYGWNESLLRTDSTDTLYFSYKLVSMVSASVEIALTPSSVNDLLSKVLSSVSNSNSQSRYYPLLLYYSILTGIRSRNYIEVLEERLKDFYYQIFFPCLPTDFKDLRKSSRNVLLMSHYINMDKSPSYLTLTYSQSAPMLLNLLDNGSNNSVDNTWSLQVLICYFEKLRLQEGKVSDDKTFTSVIKTSIDQSILSLSFQEKGSHSSELSVVDTPSSALTVTLLLRWLRAINVYLSRDEVNSWLFTLCKKLISISSSPTTQDDTLLLKAWRLFLYSSETYELPVVFDGLLSTFSRLIYPEDIPSTSDIVSLYDSIKETTLKSTPENLGFVLDCLQYLPLKYIQKQHRVRIMNIICSFKGNLPTDQLYIRHSLYSVLSRLMQVPCSAAMYNCHQIIYRIISDLNSEISGNYETEIKLIIKYWIGHIDSENKYYVLKNLIGFFLENNEQVPIYGMSIFLNELVQYFPNLRQISKDEEIVSKIRLCSGIILNKISCILDKFDVSQILILTKLLECCNAFLRAFQPMESERNLYYRVRANVESTASSLAAANFDLSFLEAWISYQSLLVNDRLDFLKLIAQLVFYRRLLHEFTLRGTDIERAISKLTLEGCSSVVTEVLSTILHTHDALDHSILLKVITLIAKCSDIFEVNKGLTSLVLCFCAGLLVQSHEIDAFTVISILDVLDVFANKTSKVCNVDSFNFILSSVSSILSSQKSINFSYDENLVVSRIISILRGMLYNHRSYMTGRFHVLFGILKKILHCMFRKTTSTSSKTDALMDTPKWFNPSMSISDYNVIAFSRLLNTWMNPNLMHDSNKKASTLTDSERQFIKASTKHFVFLLIEFLSLQVVYTIDLDTKERLTEAFYSVYGNLSTYEKHMASTSMNAPTRSLFYKFVDNWSRFAKWQES
ncbi:ribosome biogenesis protein Urb2 [Schizosaccharomyces cryophilus OY26]|uniref:Ribosome biogenesis protein Urb2 n=1 Tax=Schizosaccharomyces cryophilus (strain OY26 / ATCC MYA-4695 / CBS 11777 / NBRC 106824 / NRRL Y48691) TaxID=653667 RepID=S9W1Y6_SCHCR|nr:ribosome biogenesis protein Urb2 [Schizosaccharomyces cryophilus OY26]EPY54063.1 ribosome biogenesis protein Urb2 [Schizosaccharomyces cryophilus OY26]